jgi:uncharacterized protein Yka (UPF0111/DUF47 family)
MLNFFPREEKFIKMLKDLDSQAGISARLLKTLVEKQIRENQAGEPQSGTSVCRETSDRIKQCRRDAKKILEVLTQEICRTLITPFDREDIQQFALALYQIPKLIGKITERMLAHDMHSFKGDFERFTILIERQAEAMSALLEEISGKPGNRAISAKAAILYELEDQGDELLGQMITLSFQEIADTRELILRKDIYEMLEDVTDQYRDAAGVALQIMLKHT